MTVRRRRGAWIVVGIVAALAIAIPVLGADPSPTADPSGSTSPAATAALETTTPTDSSAVPSTSAEPDETATPNASAEPDETAEPGDSTKPDKTDTSDKTDKSDDGSEVAVTVQGTIQQGTDGQGRPTFTLTAAGKTWDLSDGPPWFWGDKNPLKAYVGKSVTVVGSSEDGGSELDVTSVDGTALRAPGKPPWAGGPWVVGPTHPGWKPWMADGKPGKGKTTP